MPSSAVQTLVEFAPAKINLTLQILGRREDGYHLLESLVAFADVGDRLSLTPGPLLRLTIRGPMADALDSNPSDNLVIRAAQGLAHEVPGLRLGRFALIKRLPVASGIGGGSSDAAAALRLLARANRIALDDARILRVARRLGADVPVCVDPMARTMRGIGERLSNPVMLPPLAAVLVNPGVALSTAAVFAQLGRTRRMTTAGPKRLPRTANDRDALLLYLDAARNDLEAPALALAPAVGRALQALRKSEGCDLARMSGSGATCFGIFASIRAARSAASFLAERHPRWWVQATSLR